jgi:hypothetical protein
MTHVDPGLINCGPRPRSDVVHLVYSPVDLLHGFSYSKIIPKILKNPWTPYFCKNTPELLQNYILVPIILHLCPYLTFHNYN